MPVTVPEMDAFNLQRFVDAQAPVWDQVRAELTQAHKRTHWMWFVFPQLAALGRSGTAKFYGISGADEARAYLEHPVLGTRLLESCELLLNAPQVSAIDIFGDIDAMKLRSSMTLFQLAAPDDHVFARVIDRFFDGAQDAETLRRV